MTLIYIREYLLQFEDLCKAFMYMENLEDRSEVDIDQELLAPDARSNRKPVYECAQMNNEFNEDYFEIVSCNYDIDTNDGIFYEKVGKYYEAR
jgi:hypothetical protein